MKNTVWPINSIPVVKCNHRFGAVMTFSFQTDSRFENSIYAGELYGFKNNTRLGAFVTNLLDQYVKDIDITEKTGLMRHDIYFGTDYWKNPVNGNIEVIPDYYATTWTSSGATYFNVTPGTSKAARTPDHGQPMFDLSGGELGYDFVNSVMGANQLQEVKGVEEVQQNWLLSVVGRIPSTGSYRNGRNTGAYTHLMNWSGFRNSVPSPTILANRSNTQYGSNLGYPVAVTNRNTFINYPNSSRWWDSIYGEGIPEVDATQHLVDELNNTLANSGWYRDFCHWHSARANNTLPALDQFLGIFRDTVGSNFVWTCSNGEAIEYLFVREICSRITATEKDNTVIIVCQIDDQFKFLSTSGLSQKLNYIGINTPLSVEIDLTGTYLAGKNVKSSYGKIRGLGSNKYIVQIPFKHREGFISVNLFEASGGLFTETIPTATTNISSGKLTITTNIPTKCVLFSVSDGGSEYDSLPEARSNAFSTSHVFGIGTGKDYRAGIISEFGQADLITI